MIHGIDTPRREAFYWAAVVATFATGTAVGDLTATTLHLGYFHSGLLFAAVIALCAICYWRFHLNPVLAFWSAHVMTRPFGASFADWIGKPANVGGLGVGDGWVSLGLTIVIALFVGYLVVSRVDVQPTVSADRPRAAG